MAHRFVFLFIWLLLGFSAAHSAPENATTAAGACPRILQHTVLRLQDEKPQALCQYAGQVVVVVNTASFCGFTPQYKGLEALYAKYKENTFGVKFPMFVKTTVRGTDALPLFKQLAEQTGTTPKWNFYKYVISRDGKDIKSFSSMTGPQDKSFVQEIEKQLAVKASAP
jgi:glutathione peroxidase